MNDVSCLVLAGGLGTRLRSVTGDQLPKVLVEIKGTPHLETLIRNLDSLGFSEIVFSLGHLSTAVIERLARISAKTPIRTLIEDTPLGTGGAVICNLAEINSDIIVIVNGDTIFDFSPEDLMGGLSKDVDAIVLVFPVKGTTLIGNIELEGNLVSEIGPTFTKGSGQYRHAGVTIVKRTPLMSEEYRETPFDFELEVLGPLVKRGRVRAVVGSSFIDFGTPEDYLKAND